MRDRDGSIPEEVLRFLPQFPGYVFLQFGYFNGYDDGPCIVDPRQVDVHVLKAVSRRKDLSLYYLRRAGIYLLAAGRDQYGVMLRDPSRMHRSEDSIYAYYRLLGPTELLFQGA